MTGHPPDECTTRDAARLLNIGDTMLRRLCSHGFITRHRRGFTTVSGAVQGYARFLRDGADRAGASAAQARQHRAKAEKIRRATARRRAGLIGRSEVELIISQVADEAIQRLHALDVEGLVNAATAATFAVEIAGAVGRIEGARARVIAGLRGNVDGADDD